MPNIETAILSAAEAINEATHAQRLLDREHELNGTTMSPRVIAMLTSNAADRASAAANKAIDHAGDNSEIIAAAEAAKDRAAELADQASMAAY